MLLPKRGLCLPAWQTYYDYSPAWAIGRDYCDLVAVEDDLFFFLGDAAGKGIAGSMIGSQLHVLFRALLPLQLPLNQLVERVNRIFSESGATDYYATLVCGRAPSVGAFELINAGHLPPLLLRSGQAMPLFASGPPLGLFPTSRYAVNEIQLIGGRHCFSTLMESPERKTRSMLNMVSSDWQALRLGEVTSAQTNWCWPASKTLTHSLPVLRHSMTEP